MHRRIALVPTLLVCLIASPAAADGPYVALDVGAAIAPNSDLSLPEGISGSAQFNAGFMIGGAAGYRFLDDFRAEVYASYRQTDIDELKLLGVPISTSGDVNAITTMVNAYYDFDFGSPARPYIGGGVGVAWLRVDSKSEFGPFILTADDGSTEFAWNIMAGYAFAITEKFDLSLGYRYLSISDAKLDATLEEVGVGSESGKLDIEYSAHEVMFGVRYNF